MSSTKRVLSQDGSLAPYDIYANVVTIHGNLTIIGNSSTIETSNTAVYDNTIVLNAGETGAGVTAGTSGIAVDRGLLPNVAVLWDEGTGKWTLTNDGSTYSPIVTLSSGGAAGGSDTQVQYNSGGTLTGSSNFVFTGGNLKVYNTIIGNGNITTTSSTDLTLSANNSGVVYINDILKMSFQAVAPTNVASTVQMFANTVGTGNSGLYVVNNNTGDELITKMRALAFNLLMS